MTGITNIIRIDVGLMTNCHWNVHVMLIQETSRVLNTSPISDNGHCLRLGNSKSLHLPFLQLYWLPYHSLSVHGCHSYQTQKTTYHLESSRFYCSFFIFSYVTDILFHHCWSNAYKKFRLCILCILTWRTEQATLVSASIYYTCNYRGIPLHICWLYPYNTRQTWTPAVMQPNKPLRRAV
jgi:hypothetical protein